MTEQLRESLSAVMDGEADEFEIRRVLDEAATDPELRGVWERYHLMRSVMRGEGHGRTRTEVLTSRLWAQIEREDATGTDESAEAIVESIADPLRASSGRKWGQRITGAAIAAGVAAAVILGFGNGEQSNTSNEVAVIEPVQTPASAAMVGDTTTDEGPVVPAALDVQRVHAYMLHHAHHVALNNRSVVPFVKVAAFESQ
jgi:sigma-E factor negative regulatory protein RseA